MSDKVFRAAAVQLRSGLNWRDNVAQADPLIRAAAAKGATLVATPEMTTILDRNAKRLAAALPENGEERAAFAALARETGVWLALGSTPTPLEDGRFANRTLVFSPSGDVVASYDKIHMFDVALENGESWRESSVYAAGEVAQLLKGGPAEIGLTICYDLRFPQLFRALAKAGAEVILTPSAFTRPTGEAHWEVLLRARAIECGAFIIAAAQGGRHEDGRETWGRSMIVGPWGDVIAKCDNDEPGLAIAEIDLARAEAARRQIPSLRLDQAFSVAT